MMKIYKQFLILFAGLLLASFAQAELKEGKEYKPLPNQHPVETPGKLEVIEFFWFGCGHCNSIEPYVEAWAKKLPSDVRFRRVHVIWPGRADILAHAKIFSALDTMGVEAQYQQEVFNAIHKDGLELRDEKVLNPWLKKKGIDQAKFQANYNSFSSNVQLKKLEQLTKDYAIEGVPTFIVNGKYMTSPVMVEKEDGTITQVIDELLAKDRKPAGKKK